MLKEFKEFALRGNVLDLAVGVVLGVAFNAVVNALANDVLMNLIAGVFGRPDFSELGWRVGEATVAYGVLVGALLNFALIAAVLFVVVKGANRLLRPEDAPPEPPTMRECPYCTTSIAIRATRCPACTSRVEARPA